MDRRMIATQKNLGRSRNVHDNRGHGIAVGGAGVHGRLSRLQGKPFRQDVAAFRYLGACSPGKTDGSRRQNDREERTLHRRHDLPGLVIACRL